MLKAVVFVRRHGASGAGHVGWAFEYGDETFNVGAVENTAGYFLDGPMQMAFWTQRTAQPVAPMKMRHYDEFKLIEVQQPNPSYAWQVVQWVGHHWYSFAWHNCMDSTYDVLRAFGVPNLPPPVLHWLPNGWFDSIQAEHHEVNEIDDTQLKKATVQPLHIPVTQTIAPPAWRIASTPEAQELQDSIATQQQQERS